MEETFKMVLWSCGGRERQEEETQRDREKVKNKWGLENDKMMKRDSREGEKRKGEL